MDEELLRRLQEFGLGSTESKVYLALLESGKSKAGSISKKTAVNRTNVYDALERLIEKGLASYVTENNKKVFEVVDPESLKEILEERQAGLKTLIQSLKSRYNAGITQEDATVFRGKTGIKAIFEDILKENKSLFCYVAESRFREIFPFYQKHWNDRRVRLKIRLKMIYSEKVKETKKEENLKLLEMRFLPESYVFPSMVMIYGEKVVTIVWTETPFAFMIKSKDAAKSYMNFFTILWKTAR